MSSKWLTAFVRSGAARSLVQAGWPGLRFTERLENYRHLPTDDFTHVNFGYVSQVASLNLSLACIAGSPARPTVPRRAARSAP